MRSIFSAAAAVLLTVVGLAVGAGCDRFDDCDALCGVARGAYDRCLEAQGPSWSGSADFESGDDFDNWCGTWTSGQRLLADTAEDSGPAQDALQATCQARQQTLGEGDCDAFFAVLLD